MIFVQRRLPLLISSFVLAGASHAGDGSEFFLDGFEAFGAEITAFRMSTLGLRDPHVFEEPFIGCEDLTEDFNTEIINAINSDGDFNGLLDLSIVLAMRPLDQSGVEADLDIIDSDCTSPVDTTTCAPAAQKPLLATTTYQALADPVCLETLAGTTGGYMPAPTLPMAPCFNVQPVDMSLRFLGTSLPLQDAHLGATFVGAPANQLVNGLYFGFLTEADADATPLPEHIPFIGGEPWSSVLPGGTGNCSANDDRDMHEAQTGWWLYFNFEAEIVPFSP